jgi:PAS domain S-box-containing protein
MASEDEQGAGHRFGGGALMEQAAAARRALRGPRNERERLQSLAGFRVVGTGAEPEFDAMARLAARMAGTETAAITFVDGTTERVKAAAGAHLPDVERAHAFGGDVVANSATLVVDDAHRDHRFSENPWVTGQAAVRFYAGVPLMAGGQPVGTLAVMDAEPRAATSDLLAALDDAVSALMPQLERRREQVMAQNLTAVVGFDRRFQRVSPAFEAVLGWRADEMVGRDCLDFVHPDDLGRERARIERLIGGYPGLGGFESRYRCKEGGHRWLLWNSQVVPHEKLFYCAGKDITDRKRNETALRESEARYRMLAENATDIVSGHDLDGRITYVSSAVETLTGWRVGEVIGRDIYEMFHRDDVERVRESHRRLLARMQPVRDSYRLHCKDGSWLWVESNARVVRDQHSRPVGIQSATRDITEIKEAVEELRAAREHFRRAFDDAPIGMCIATRDGRFERVNRRFSELLGFSEEELLGTVSVDVIHSDDRGGEEEGLRELLGGERPTYAIEKRLLDRNGEAVWARVTTSVLRDGPDAEPRLLAHVEDVSDRRRHAEELRQAGEAAERANRAKSEFLSRMSHELRTPLNAVLGFAQLVDADDDLSDSQRESIGRVLRGGYHLLNLVNEVLDMSAIEAGRLPILPEAVAAGPVVNETLELLRPQAAERSIRLHCELPAGEVVLSANAQRLKQVLLNLTANAIKYSRPGADVTVAVRSGDGPRVRIDVVDTGPGIPADQIDRAFLPFERLGARRDVEGTGLGLPLSLNLVEAMGGTLTVESGSGGSTFTVDLPRAEKSGDARDAAEAAAAPRADARNGHGPPRRILYIEDNELNVALMERLVERRPDLELHAASRGDAGVELARRLSPDVVVVDLHLPDMTGDAVVAELQAAPETSDVPVIVVSADATQDHAKRLIAAGATAFMTKPLDLGRFQAELDRALARTSPAA